MAFVPLQQEWVRKPQGAVRLRPNPFTTLFTGRRLASEKDGVTLSPQSTTASIITGKGYELSGGSGARFNLSATSGPGYNTPFLLLFRFNMTGTTGNLIASGVSSKVKADNGTGIITSFWSTAETWTSLTSLQGVHTIALNGYNDGGTWKVALFHDGAPYNPEIKTTLFNEYNWTFNRFGGNDDNFQNFNGVIDLFGYAHNVNVPDKYVSELVRRPYAQLFEPEEIPVFFSAGGGTTHNLEADAAAQAAATGALSVSVPMAGAAVALASATGDLSVSSGVALAGNATAQANATGGLSLSVPLSASAVANAIAAAQMALAKPLTGAAAAQSASTGALTLNISLAGNAIAQAAASAGLTIEGAVDLEGSAAAQSTATGALTHAVPLSGAALTVSSADGSLTHIVPLTGAAAAASLATGGLDLTVNLAADALAQAMASAGLTVTTGTGLAGAAAAQAAAAGTLTLRVNLDGAAVANAIASGALAGTGTLSGTPGFKIERKLRVWKITNYPSRRICA